MEQFLIKLKKLRDLTVFDGEKKASARADLLSYMRGTNAVRAVERERHYKGNESIFNINQKNKKTMPVFAFITILALIGGGTSFAAEQALPGDALYSVKVNVNEKVASALAVSATAKANLEASIVDRRLAEADKLAAEGKLNAKAEVELKQAFEASADRTEARVRSLRDSGKKDDAAAIEGKLNVILKSHSESLTALLDLKTGSSTASRDELESIVTSVKLRIENKEGQRTDQESPSSSVSGDVEVDVSTSTSASTSISVGGSGSDDRNHEDEPETIPIRGGIEIRIGN